MIYFFGDSFTKGDGCNVGFEYYNLPTDLPKKKWTDIISEELNQPTKNFGKSGAGSQWIYNKLTYYLDIFKPNDWVFVTDSIFIRQLGVVQDRIETVGPSYEFETKEREMANTDNLIHNIYPFQSQWNQYYIKHFTKICEYLKSKNVNTYFTHYDEYMFKPKKYMNIVTETNNKIDDNHFSWLGHQQYAQYLIDRINESNPFHEQ